MKKMLTVEEFLGVLHNALSDTLTRDFGEKPAHIVDLISHVTTQVDGMFYFLYAFDGLKEDKSE